MLATCVNMVLSLARYRQTRPSTPFRLGGEFLRLGERVFLRDALGSLELMGDKSHFIDCESGDQIIVDVVGESLKCDKVERVTRREGEWAKPPRPHAARFPRFLNEVRAYFLNRGLNEILTPSLVLCPGLEPTLEPFSVAPNRYLPTSPEVHLKKAMALGFTDIFELKPCFRRGEFSPHHQPEFTMLEWYRGFADLEMILEDLRGLLAHFGADVNPKMTTFRELFAELLGFELTPQTTAEELRGLATRFNLHWTADDSFNDLFHRLMIEHIEPELPAMGAMIVRDFPPSMAALARLTPEGWADRFEFYWRGLEIANAFNEVISPDEQTRRWEREQAERARLGTSFVPDDPELIQALTAGLPPSGGVALGLERLYMALHEVANIRDLRLF